MLPLQKEAQKRLRRASLRHLFTVAAVLNAFGAATYLLLPAMAPLARITMAGCYLAAAAACLFLRHRRVRSIHNTMVLVTALSLTLLAASLVERGWGINASAMVFFALATCLIYAAASPRAGIAVGAFSALAICGMAAAELAGVLPAGDPRVTAPLALRVAVHLAGVATGLATGVLLSRVVQRLLASAIEREQRFSGLLAIAADAYWEADDQLHLRYAARRGRNMQFVATPVPPDHLAWELPQLRLDEATRERVRNEMQAHRKIHEVPMTRALPDGSLRHLLCSGEPRFDESGRFLGYWGLVRDVTAEVRAREALAQAEHAEHHSRMLLERMVAMSPDVIALTDMASGRFEMVNPAFCRAMGYAAGEVLGRTSAELGTWRSPDDRQRMLQALQDSDSVDDMVVDFVARDGRPVPMQVSATRFEMDGTPYLVINARDVSRAARERLEREAILENASIGIAFTRNRSFALVNRRFEQMYGWGPGELVGRSARVIWPSDDDFEAVGRESRTLLECGELVEFERASQRRDGSLFTARMLAKAIDPAQPAAGGTVWIVEDVTERRQVEQALARARDDAEAASQAKSAFLANTSHEIRTPLNGLVGLARLAREPELDEHRRHRYLEQIGESAQMLSAIISDILDLSKIEAGKLSVETVAFNLHDVLDSLHHAYAALADARGLLFALEVDRQVPMLVRGDPVRVRQILANYLSNGLKFTAQGGIRMVARLVGDDKIRFEVHDSGPGIDAQNQARLFQPFTQADSTTTRRFGGTGLGLSICRELATLMSGEVGLDSEPGRGSCFWAELPLPETEPLPGETAFGTLDADPLRGARVLMVEDNPVNMMIGVAMLERWGAVVEQAGDGEQAVLCVQAAAQAANPFDLVLMDVQMPGKSGHQATRELREQWDSAALPIIALTAAALVSERKAALDAGMDDFVTKPIDERRLHDTLVRALTLRAQTV